MAHIAPDVVSYEHAGPLQYEGVAEVREVCRRGLEASSGHIEFDTPNLTVTAFGDLAWRLFVQEPAGIGTDRCWWSS